MTASNPTETLRQPWRAGAALLLGLSLLHCERDRAAGDNVVQVVSPNAAEGNKPAAGQDAPAAGGSAEAAGRASQAVRTPFTLEETSIEALQKALAARKYTSRQLVELYLARIAELDRRGPALHAIIERNPDALSIADALDGERQSKGPRGPLHGIPIVIKDNIDTGDKMMTTAGSLALVGPGAAEDAFIVARLRQAGAIILAKTNLSEWANFRSMHSVSGWSGRGGLTKNPYVLDRSACGSSSGTGTAVAANLAVAGIGTETDGSIVCPSSVNGLVGIKPSIGLVSRSGIVPISASQDTAGPMARSVRDAALLLTAIVGADPKDPTTSAASTRAESDYTRFLDAQGLKGARIGVAREKLFGYSPQSDKILEGAIRTLREQGATIVDPANIGGLDRFGEAEEQVLLYEFKDGLNRYLANRDPSMPVHSLAELIKFNEAHAANELPLFGQDLLEKAQSKGPLSEPAYQTALARCRREAREAGLDRTLKEHQLDAIIAPTGSPAWSLDVINGDHFLGSSSSPAAVAGYPSISVPAGFSGELPVGISFIGKAFSEPTLLRLAYAYEQASKQRRPPRFIPTLDVSETAPPQDER